MSYQAWVRVVTPDYSYWNKLGPVHPTQEDANDEVTAYAQHKLNGTGGFRQGAPAMTCVRDAR